MLLNTNAGRKAKSPIEIHSILLKEASTKTKKSKQLKLNFIFFFFFTEENKNLFVDETKNQNSLTQIAQNDANQADPNY